MLNNHAQSSTTPLFEGSSEPAQTPLHVVTEKRARTDSHRLLQGGRELYIAHAGEEYRLRLTRNDKLILTK